MILLKWPSPWKIFKPCDYFSVKTTRHNNYKSFNIVFYKEVFNAGSNHRKHLYLEHLCTMASISSIEKHYMAPTRHSFKNCILACKMITNFEKRKVPQAVSGNSVQN